MQFSKEFIGYNSFAIYAALGVIVLTTLYYFLKKRGLPPGPTGIPFLGYWPFLDSEGTHLQLHRLGKKYGNVFSFNVTGSSYINLGSVAAIREALINKAEYFTDRSEKPHLLFEQLDGGMLFMTGEPWKVIRKFFQLQFRERGLTVIRNELSGSMYDTVRSIVNDLEKQKGKPLDITSILVTKCSEIIRQTLFGTDGMTEEEMKKFCKHHTDTINVATSANLLPTGLISKFFILPYVKGMKEAQTALKITRSLLYKAIDRRRSTFNDNHIRDIVDAFIKEGKIRQSKKDPLAKYFNDEVLMVTLLQVVGDGIVFLSNFIGAFLKALVNHPEEQEKIYKELVEVVGLDRNPGTEDKSKLTYTNAFISEVMRTSDLFTIFPTVECAKETTISGYRIPKGSILMYNFWMAHMNPEDHEEPEKFNPSRFITAEGKKRPELPLLFGIGKRSCAGEGYSMIQVFLFVTTIVKNFHLRKPTDNMLALSQDLHICAFPRSENITLDEK